MDEQLYSQHLSELTSQWATILERNSYDSAIIAAGENSYFYDDDQSPPFHANPHFLRWTVCDESEHCVMVLASGRDPKLLWFTPKDYWYLPSSIPRWLSASFSHEVHDSVESIAKACEESLAGMQRTAFVGPLPSPLSDIANVEPASAALMDQLAYVRAYKTPFEVDNLVQAEKIGASGHIAARDAFLSGASEFEIHLAFLSASKQSFHELPYPSIVGINEHASTLHYQLYDREPPETSHSLLIDAGAKHLCYHSDITRTYTNHEAGDFKALLHSVEAFQQQLVQELPSMKDFVEFHVRTHELVAQTLVEHGIVRCSASAAYEQKLTDVFYPHGTGHLLGLQTHDLGGHIVDESGTPGAPPERFPSLRLIRNIEAGMVFTVEPGIYFIPVLLAGIQGQRDIDWDKVEGLIPCGGIRIEDNVLIEDVGLRNLTREAFANDSNSANG